MRKLLYDYKDKIKTLPIKDKYTKDENKDENKDKMIFVY